jgi:hypothetical protein
MVHNFYIHKPGDVKEIRNKGTKFLQNLKFLKNEWHIRNQHIETRSNFYITLQKNLLKLDSKDKTSAN